MAASSTLTRLLRDLKAVSSPLERMRVAARAWRSLRRLRPEERKELATQVGLEGAEEILEGLGRGEKRLAPVLVLGALEKAKKADPSQLRSLVKGLRDRDKRGAILQKWMDSVSDGLVEEEEEEEEEKPEAPAEAKPPAPVRESPPSPVEPEKAPPAAKPSPPAKPPPVAKPPEVIPAPEPPVAIPVVSAPPEPAPAPEPPPKPAAAAPEPAQPRRVPPPIPVPVPVPRPKPAGAGGPQAVRQPVPAAEPLADRLHHTNGLILRFRELRSGLDRNGGGRLGDLPHLLEAFPAGWARRRALAALLRRRIPADLEDALALVDGLESPAARRWCLGTILEHWELPTEQQDQLRRRRRSS